VIARLVIREAARRRLLLALLLLTLVVIALTGWGFSRIPTITQRGAPLPDVQVKLVASQFLIVTMFMFSFVLGMTAVFIASPAIAGDVESGVALALLARPIRRAELLAGKWLGNVVVLVACVLLAGALLQGAAGIPSLAPLAVALVAAGRVLTVVQRQPALAAASALALALAGFGSLAATVAGGLVAVALAAFPAASAEEAAG